MSFEFSENPHEPGLEWFALAVKPQHEKAVASNLRHQGFVEFLPLYRSRRRWSDRVRDLELPLFAGYVFSRFSRPERTAVLRTPGVKSVVGFGGIPAAIDAGEMDSLRSAASSGLALAPWPFLKAGDRVRIERGPLAGIRGIVLNRKGGCRLVLSVTLLQRAVAVEIGHESIVPASL